MIKDNYREIETQKENEFINIIENNKEQYYRIAYSYLKNEADALEVIQEAVYKGYKALKEIRELKYIKTWFVRILINESNNKLKERKKISNLFQNEETLKKQEKVDNIQSYEKQIDLEIDLTNALRELSEEEKTIIVLKYFEDYTFQEISEVIKRPINTVKTTMYRALKKMKIDLEEVEIYGK